ncbi:MAG: hypothetical protein ACK4TA_15640 [Saprospiraceae bacterium]
MMNVKKQLVFPMLIALGVSVFGACGGDNPNSMQDNGNATGTLPEGDNTTSPDLRDTSTMESERDSMGRVDTSGIR